VRPQKRGGGEESGGGVVSVGGVGEGEGGLSHGGGGFNLSEKKREGGRAPNKKLSIKKK